MAQPTKLNDSVQQTLVRAISLGATRKAAAQAAGITYETLYNWEQKAYQGKQPFLGLFQALEKAEGERQMRWLGQIEKVAHEGAWQAAAWKLERLHSETYALRQKVDVQLSVEEVQQLDDRTLDAYIEAAAAQPARLAAGRTRAKAS